MSVESVLARVAALEHALAEPASLLAARTGGTPAPTAVEPATSGGGSFAQALQSASGEAAVGLTAAGVTGPGAVGSALGTAGVGVPASTAPGAAGSALGTAGVGTPTGTTGPGAQIVRAAETQLGQTEQPPGSNEAPAIAAYRTATAGAIPGAPWCAYFASWAARQAGEPLGANGEGLGSVAQIWSWAQSTGRAIPNGPGVVPQPGDLIVFGDAHVGIVRDVLPNGDVQTIEGNYENKVAANVRTPTEATGYVDMN
jgi:CHAP domain